MAVGKVHYGGCVFEVPLALKPWRLIGNTPIGKNIEKISFNLHMYIARGGRGGIGR